MLYLLTKLSGDDDFLYLLQTNTKKLLKELSHTKSIANFLCPY